MSNDVNGLDWLREIRKNISAECENDPKKMGEYFRKTQKRYENRIFRDDIVLTVNHKKVIAGSHSTDGI